MLTNAINYSYEDGDINVRVYRDDFRVIFEVQDFGIGIKLEDQQRIFERFYRVDKARSRDSGGTRSWIINYKAYSRGPPRQY